MNRIEKTYGFGFPRDLARFYAIARRHGDALFEAGVRFAGPLALLDGWKLEADLGRWASDPPELFTVAEGDTDGLWLRANRIAKAPEAIGALRLESLDIGKNPLAKNKDERAKLKKLARKASIHFT